MITEIAVCSLVCFTWVKISKSVKSNTELEELSTLSKLETEISILKQERNDYSSLVTHLLGSSIELIDVNIQSRWERDFCQSLIRNQNLMTDARLTDTGSVFSHAINILRSNYKDLEKQYFNKTFFQNYKITEQVIYGCLDGDKESLMVMFSSVIERTKMLNESVLLNDNSLSIISA